MTLPKSNGFEQRCALSFIIENVEINGFENDLFSSASQLVFCDNNIHIPKTMNNEAPRSKAAGVSHESIGAKVALTMPCPSRSRAAGYND